MRISAACLLCLMLLSGALSDVAGPESVGGRISQAAAASITQDYDNPPVDVRQWFYNHGNTGDRNGDCVWVSTGMVGVIDNNIAAASLPWDTPFGKANRCAAGPSQLAKACAERGIAVYNVTGASINDTHPWAVYAVETGRGAAIGFGRRHFQTLLPEWGPDGEWLVCDNNSPERVDHYFDSAFCQLHAASGFWIVVLDGPACPPPINNVIPSRKRLSWSGVLNILQVLTCATF
jgi:hypothetical protein